MPALDTIGITDAGGRGAALVHAYGRSPNVRKIVVTPGNDLMDLHLLNGVELARIPSTLAARHARRIARLLRDASVKIADVCRDDLVAGGCVDALRNEGVSTLGPTRVAGRVEWDKAWARGFMQRHGIPHPAFHVFRGEDDGVAFLRGCPDQKWAVKASGLAQGKGVILASDNTEAEEAVRRMRRFGKAGATYVLEQYVEGEEFSAFAVSDGASYQILGAQDHKRAFDGDRGPNTGGMGSSSSPLVVTPDVLRQVHDILRRTFEGLTAEGCPYTGILYLGGMVADGNVQVIEYNARWGDPEAQVILPGIRTDLVEVARAVIERRVDRLRVEIDTKVRVAVAVVSRGYPDDHAAARGREILGIDETRSLPGVTLYGAGVKREGGRYYADGGRLLYVVGEGDDVIEARDVAYDAVDRIRVEGGNGQYRTDIGHRDVARVRQ